MDAGEPVAVVGMACRFPGANDVASFWRLLEAGENAVAEGVPGSGVGASASCSVPSTFRTSRAGSPPSSTTSTLFDAAFFRISPLEAQLLDPQQRLMLETSWQALEDAGIDPDALHGSRTGVYGGISNNDYRGLVLEASDPDGRAASLYAVNGSSYNTAIGESPSRLAYRVRRSRLTPPARHHSSPFTRPWPVCSRARPTWRWPAGCTPSCPGG